MSLSFILAAGMGLVAGLRAMTAPAAVSWAAYLGWLHLQGSPLSFMASGIAVTIFSTLAVVEYIVDLLPTTPDRTAPGPLFGRVLMGGLSAAALGVSAGGSLLTGALLGGLGALIGAFAGYQIRGRLVRELKVKDAVVAIPEDLLAILLAYVIVSR